MRQQRAGQGCRWALAVTCVPDEAAFSTLDPQGTNHHVSMLVRVQAGAADLSPAQAVQGGWGLAQLGDKDGAAALLAAAAAAVQKVARDSLSCAPWAGARVPESGKRFRAHRLLRHACLAFPAAEPAPYPAPRLGCPGTQEF